MHPIFIFLPGHVESKISNDLAQIIAEFARDYIIIFGVSEEDGCLYGGLWCYRRNAGENFLLIDLRVLYRIGGSDTCFFFKSSELGLLDSRSGSPWVNPRMP